MTQDEKFMKAAITQAKKAAAIDEVPIGCVIVQNGKIIARGYNRRNTDKNTLAHAELTAIRKASKKTGDWRLEDCTMYVTLEPCQMCAGAIVQSRMQRVVIATMNAKAGCAGSVLNLLQMQEFNHQVEITRGVLQEECSTMLSRFFRELRERKKANFDYRTHPESDAARRPSCTPPRYSDSHSPHS
jgi:tRNA(adenine34) deaminase